MALINNVLPGCRCVITAYFCPTKLQVLMTCLALFASSVFTLPSWRNLQVLICWSYRSLAGNCIQTHQPWCCFLSSRDLMTIVCVSSLSISKKVCHLNRLVVVISKLPSDWAATSELAGGDGLVPTKTGQKCGRDAEMSQEGIGALFSSESHGSCYVKEGLARC